jgi:hypothetical protein
VTCAAQIGGVVGASEHEDGSTVTANTSEPVTSLSANEQHHGPRHGPCRTLVPR